MDSIDVWEALHITHSVATFFKITSCYHAAIEFYKELLILVKIVENLAWRQYNVEMIIYNRLLQCFGAHR